MEALKISVVTLGCKVNQCESATIAAALDKLNIETSEGLQPADVYILNTCSVTAEADRKSRQHISKMIKLNPDCKIIVIGCSSQKNNKLFDKPNVIAIGGNKNKQNFAVSEIIKLTNADKYSILSDRILYNTLGFDDISIENEQIYPKFDKTRYFIKIQDGCNRFCTYCIIPYLRGRSRSRSIEDVICECRTVNSREIVVTGIDISAYGKDIGVSLAELLRAMGGIPSRKRLGSLECEAVSDDFLQAMRDGGFCPHFHLSLQSGSDDVLRSMNRKYDTRYYYDKVSAIRKYFPMAGITTDIIVGFPTESDKNFDDGIEFIKKCAFSDIHIFPYSSREGTLAARKYKILPKDIVYNREQRLLKIKSDAKSDFINKNLGTYSEIYAETVRGGYSVGYTPNYIKVYSRLACGSIGKLKLTAPIFDGILGE